MDRHRHVKAGEIVALTTLELALKNRYGDKVKDRRGNILFDRLPRYMVEHDDLTDDKLPVQQRCGVAIDRRSQTQPRQHPKRPRARLPLRWVAELRASRNRA
jgi:hypothetical protein